jgi:hypothetical protein
MMLGSYIILLHGLHDYLHLTTFHGDIERVPIQIYRGINVGRP